MSSPEIKNISLLPEGKSVCIYLAIPSHSEGRRPSSRTLGGLRWTLVLRETTAWRSVRQNRVVLAPVAGVKLPEKRKLNRQRRSQPRTRLRGDHGISRKAIAQGRPGVLRCPVCSCAAYFVQTARGTAGAARTRSSLRPLIGGRGSFWQSSGAMRRENANVIFTLSSPALDRATQYSRDANDRTEKPRRTGSPAFAEDDSDAGRQSCDLPHIRSALRHRNEPMCIHTATDA